MVTRTSFIHLLCCLLLFSSAAVAQDQAGSIRGVIYDKDFDVPLSEAQVSIAETGQKATSSEEGNYLIPEVKPGVYTLVFSKPGYTRQLKADVVVSAGQMTEVDVWLTGEFAEMEEFVVQDIQFGSGTEIQLLELRMEAPALMDSISSDLMSQAGAGDAASALKLVTGATVQDGKYAVIRGLPDRYVNSQLNGVRLPTADADKRAVHLDLFPSDIIESIQVSKTFTPDQQGDASGGAVNVILKGIPEETVLKLSLGTTYDTQVTRESDFLTYRGGGVDFWGTDDGGRDVQSDRIGKSWEGAVGVSEDDSPWDYSWSVSAGGKHEFDNGIKVGGFGNFFYDRGASYFEDGIDDKYWVPSPGSPMIPQYFRGSPTQGDFKTSLYDVSQGSEEVNWGGLGVLGVETEKHALTLLYMYTRVAEDVATLGENVRGKEYYFPGYDRDDPNHPGNQERDASPYLRTETLEYTERTTETLQLSGEHELPGPRIRAGDFFRTFNPELDWGVSHSVATLYQPDKRLFGTMWWAPSYNPGFPPYVPPFTSPAIHRQFKPAANFTMGNIQRIWKDISEESDQYFLNLKLPFEQWGGDEGYIKFGLFNDDVSREYKQESFSNFNDNTAEFEGDWEDFWSEVFPDENHPITVSHYDADYDGEQKISAWYYMVDFPLTSYFKVIGGARFEKTELNTTIYPDPFVTWIPPGTTGQVRLRPGDGDASFERDDILPSIGFELKLLEEVTVRGSYSETVARQTFKELTPIQQMEFLGGDVFVGNPELGMSSLENWDLRVDYVPYDGALLSFSYFYKDVKDPIEYVQRVGDFAFTTPTNYPEGKLKGYEVEIRQKMGHFWNFLEGLAVGANATFIDSEVTLSDYEKSLFDQSHSMGPMSERDMTNAPEHLYNFFFTYDFERTNTKLGLFYTVRGDTLIAGAAPNVPSVYETEFGTLNLSISQKINETWSAKFQAKNLTDPEIETVYRSEYIEEDVTKTSYKKGIEFSFSVSAEF